VDFPKVFPMPPHGDMLVRWDVTVYKTQAEYLANVKDAPEWSAGLHWVDVAKPGWPMLYVATYPCNVAAGQEVDFVRNFPRPVLQHEAAHAMLQKFAGRSFEIPVFVNEGCASYFETWNLRVQKPSAQERSARFRRSHHLYSVIRQLATEPGWRPALAPQLALTHETWEQGDIGLHYGLAEAFIDYLLLEKERREVFRRMLERVYKRQKVVLEAAEVQKLEPGWQQHLVALAAELSQELAKRGLQIEGVGAPGVGGGPEKEPPPATPRRILNVRDPDGKPYGTGGGRGVTGYGEDLTVTGMPDGVVITPEELEACKTPAELDALLQKKLDASTH